MRWPILFRWSVVLTILSLLLGPARVRAPGEVHLPLAGKVIVVDPGHGGIDGGTQDRSGFLEKNLTLDLALRLERILARHGATVVLTRRSDTQLGHLNQAFPSRHRRDLLSRLQIAVAAGADILISLHGNHSPHPGEYGGMVFYQQGNKVSRELAEKIQEQLCRLQPGNRQTVLSRRLFLLEHAPMPAILVEVGFLSHPQEGYLLRQPAYREKLAKGIAQGILLFFLTRQDSSSPMGN